MGGIGAAASGGKGGSGGAAVGGRGGQSAAGGRGGTGAQGGSGGGAAATRGVIEIVPNVVAGKQKSTGSGGVGSQSSALRVGSPSATTLKSLKYYITSIQLCEDAELMGTGFKSINGCVQLYQNMPAGSPDYDTYTVEEAIADTATDHFIDLMSSEGQAALRKPVMLELPLAAEIPGPGADDADAGVTDAPKREPGVYRYGLINFYRPIKVTAEFPIIGEAEFFRTKAVKNIVDITPPGSMMKMDRVEIGNTLMAPTEETTYMLNNGGALFVFQKPFAISKADVDAKAQIFIDLVFNPENFGQAYVTNYDCRGDVRTVICDPGSPNVSIDMPFVRMSPVPRKQGESTHKETYLVDYDNNTKVRVELYYNHSDSEALVQGVDTAIVYNGPAAPSGDTASFNTIASNFVTQTGSIAGDNASVSLLDYRRDVNLEKLVRRKDGEVTIYCLFPGSLCPANESIKRAYTYVGDSVVSGE